MSRIAIDIRPLLNRHMTGVGFALLETLRELLPSASPAREYILFASGSEETLSHIPDLPENPHVHIVRRNIPNKIVLLFSLCKKNALDILLGTPCDAWWFPNWTIAATEKPFALTIHDASFEHTPHFYSFKERFLLGLAQPKEIARCARFCIAVSEHTARDISQTWNIPQSRIATVPLGVNDQLFLPREQPSDRSYRASYDLNRPYLLSLATHEPRKNIAGILESYTEARRMCPSLPPLVLAGAKQHKLPPLPPHVQAVGYIPQKHRPALLRGATALIFPSFQEGFGLPVLEALSCNTPVVTATATPPTSLFSQGIFPASAYNTHDIARAICAAVAATPSDLHKQTKNFTWKHTSELLHTVLKRLV